MPHTEAWDFNNGKGTQEVIDGAAYVRGTAENLVEEAVKLLGGAKAIRSLKTEGFMAADGAKLKPSPWSTPRS